MGYSQNPQNIPKTKLQLTPTKPTKPIQQARYRLRTGNRKTRLTYPPPKQKTPNHWLGGWIGGC